MNESVWKTIKSIKEQSDPGVIVHIGWVINHAHVLTIENGKKLDYHINGQGQIVDIEEVDVFPNYYGVEPVN